MATTEALNEHLLAKGFAKWQLPDRCEAIAAVPPKGTGRFRQLRLLEMAPG